MTYKGIAITIIGIIILFLIISFFEYFVWKNINFHRLRCGELYNGLTFKYTNIDILHIKQIDVGYKLAKNKRIIICGLAKDILNRLKLNIERLQYLGKHFADYRIVVFENDSTDGTRELIKDKSITDHRIELVQCCEIGNCNCKLKHQSATDLTRNNRIDRMTYYRNYLLQYIKNRYSDYDYMLVMDLDTEGPCAVDGIMHSLSFPDWDVIASNGQHQLAGTMGLCTMTYDSLAFVHHTIDELVDRSNISLAPDIIRQNILIYSSTSDLIPVKSAFNGATLYKMDKLQNAQYENVMGCEHIGLHKNIRSNKIFINKFWKWYVGLQGSRKIDMLFK